MQCNFRLLLLLHVLELREVLLHVLELREVQVEAHRHRWAAARGC